MAQALTCGEYVTEPDSVAALLSIINPAHWSVRTEVDGWMLHPRLDTEGSGWVRIDAILKPTPLLIEQGWRWGFVGIECKRSGKKLGRVISQAMDYTRCVWNLPNGIDVMTRFVFVWPCEQQRGDLESMMVQNRVGVAKHREKNGQRLILFFNGTIAYADNGHQPPAIANELRGGSRKGSR
jgi:hypothetical protein